MTTILLFCLFIFLVILCGFFVASEFALLTVQKQTIQKQANSGDKKAKGVLTALSTLSTQLSGTQIGITVSSLAIGLISEPLLGPIIEELLNFTNISEKQVSFIAVIVGTITATVITMLFGELIPKNIAIAKPVAVVKFVQGKLRIFNKIMYFPIKFLKKSANLFLILVGVKPKDKLASARSADELMSVVRRSAEMGMLPKQTALLLERSMQFDDMITKDVMTPLFRIKTINSDESINDLFKLSKKTGHSRFPVYKNNEIIGLVHIKQALSIPNEKRTITAIEKILTKPIFIPSVLKLDSLLPLLQKSKFQTGIVIDEYGDIDGMVTIEDLIEELVGEVHDEHDPTSKRVVKLTKNSWRLAGILRLDEIAIQTDIYLPENEEYETIGGLLFDKLERLPFVNDQITVDAVNRSGTKIIATLAVQAMDNRRVDQVIMKIRKVNNK